MSGIALPDGRVFWQGRCNSDAPDPRFGKICASFDEWIGLVREVWAEVIKRVEEDERRDLEQQLRWIEMTQPCPHCGRNKNDLKDELPF